MLTPEEFKNVMQKTLDKWEPEDEFCGSKRYIYPHDPEMCHRTMDHIMSRLLCDLGYEEGIDIFRKAIKWYA